MTEQFKKRFKVGDKIRSPRWQENAYRIITAIGKDKFLSVCSDGDELSDFQDAIGWLPYTEPVKKVKVAPYIYQLSDGQVLMTTGFYATDSEAIACLDEGDKIIRRVTELEVEI